MAVGGAVSGLEDSHAVGSRGRAVAQHARARRKPNGIISTARTHDHPVVTAGSIATLGPAAKRRSITPTIWDHGSRGRPHHRCRTRGRVAARRVTYLGRVAVARRYMGVRLVRPRRQAVGGKV